MLIDVLLLLSGMVLVGVSAWRRSGRDGGRAWARELYSRQAFLFWLPGFGLIVAGTGLLGLGDDHGLTPVVLLGTLACAAGVLLSLWGGLFLPAPAWFLPAWLRPVVARERDAARARRAARRQRRREVEAP